MPPGEDNIFSLIHDESHTKRRAQKADGYFGKPNPSLEPTINTNIQNFMHLIRTKYFSTESEYKPVDMARKAAFLTMDVITDVAFASPFGCLINDEDMFRYIESTEQMIPVMLKAMPIQILGDILRLEWLNKLLFPIETSEEGIGKMMGLLERQRKIDVLTKFPQDRPKIRLRTLLQTRHHHQDMLSSFISKGLSEKDLVTESVLQLIAGSDTIATAIRAIILYIITNPPIYTRLQAEIDTAVAAGKVSTPVIKYSEGLTLPYLQAIILEGLRIWPPVTGGMNKISGAEGDNVFIDGTNYYIPPYTKVAWAIWGIQRSKKVFGDDADMFRPERWLIEDEEKLVYMRKVVGLNFGYGKYQCLGRPVALLELNTLCFEEFDLQIVNPNKPWNSFNVGLWMQKGAELSIAPGWVQDR